MACGLYDFVQDLFDASCVECEEMSLEEAQYDLDNFRGEGYDLPDDWTAEEYRDIWNRHVREQNEEWLRD